MPLPFLIPWTPQLLLGPSIICYFNFLDIDFPIPTVVLPLSAGSMMMFLSLLRSLRASQGVLANYSSVHWKTTDVANSCSQSLSSVFNSNCLAIHSVAVD